LQQISKAEAVFHRALAIDRNNPEAYLNLGKIASQRGDVNAAISNLEKASQLDPDNSAAFYQLGLAYKKTGQSEKSAVALKRFRELSHSPQ
jgi:Flp pilus assembly protein TadD